MLGEGFTRGMKYGVNLSEEIRLNIGEICSQGCISWKN